MSADLLTRAIEELDWWVNASTSGPWIESIVPGRTWSGVEGADGTAITTDDHSGDVFELADAALIVTIHRTIPAQLELLTLALEYGELAPGNGSRFIAVALDLARAILGDEA